MNFGKLSCTNAGSSLVKKCVILVSYVDKGQAYARVGAGGIWEISISPSQSCCKPKSTLKK